jgi:hypothetical protein
VVTGDFFQAVPEDGDLWLLPYELRDRDDDKCVLILRNGRRAKRPGGSSLCLR